VQQSPLPFVEDLLSPRGAATRAYSEGDSFMVERDRRLRVSMPDTE
jgi:hypothetical protein